jgi:hypothetical protein
MRLYLGKGLADGYIGTGILSKYDFICSPGR